MTSRRPELEPRLLDLHPPEDRFADDVLAGLARPAKELPCKYLYDERGSELFERITKLEEYYPTRTELGILRRHADEIAARIGPDCTLIEPGSGSGTKTRLLLSRLERPRAYVPIDMSREALMAASRRLAARFPGLHVLPVCADFTRGLPVPEIPRAGARSDARVEEVGRDAPPPRAAGRRVVFFPGSTIGNFRPAEQLALLRRVAEAVGEGGLLLVGIDLVKPRGVLEAAYDDREGVTAEFDLNLLVRINRELDGDFDTDAFEHRARFDPVKGRIEMQLVSTRAQTVSVGERRFDLAEGEAILTERSYKFTVMGFAERALAAGLRPDAVWTDEQGWFAVCLFAASGSGAEAP